MHYWTAVYTRCTMHHVHGTNAHGTCTARAHAHACRVAPGDEGEAEQVGGHSEHEARGLDESDHLPRGGVKGV